VTNKKLPALSLSVHVRASENAALHVQTALAALAPDEKVVWDISMQVMPNNQGGIQSLLAIFLQVPAPVLGQNISTTLMVAPDDVNEVAISAAVRQALEALRQGQSQMLAQARQQSAGANPLTGGLAAQRAAALGQRNGGRP
jgi:hypothetical protein